MKLIKNEFILCCAIGLCALQFGHAQESSTTVKINYFNNSQNISISLIPGNMVLKKSGAILENMELVPTYRSGNAFIISMPKGTSPEALKDINTSFKKTAEIKFVENPTTILTSASSGGDEIVNAVFNKYSATPATERKFRVKLKEGYILNARLPGGGYVEAFSDKEIISPDDDWFKTLVANIYLKIGDKRVTVKSFGKFFGGSGLLWAMAKQGYMDNADINIGLTWVSFISGGLPFKATMDLWDETKTHIYAFTPYDLPMLNSLIENTPKENANIPEFVSSNILLSSSSLSGHVKKYIVKEIKGVKVGFFFVMDNKVIPGLLGSLPAELSDPVTAANEAVKSLVEKEKVDVVVMLSFFIKEDLQAILEKIPGVDVVINSIADPYFSVIKTEVVKLENWGDEIVAPAMMADLKRGRIGKLKLEFSKQGDKKRLTSIMRESTGMSFDGRKRNEYDGYDGVGYLFNVSSGVLLLPDAADLWSGDKKQYMPLEIFNLAAAVLKEETKAEVAFLKIRPFSLSMVGNIPESVIKTWVKHGKIVTADISGAALVSLLKQIDFGNIPVSNYDWREKYTKGNWLSVVGVSRDGRVGGIPISHNEIYKVALTEDLLNETKNFFALSGIKNKSDTGLYVDDIVIGRLSEMKGNSQIEVSSNAENGNTGLNAAYYNQLRNLISGKSSPRWRWRLNVKDISLQFSQTQVSNTESFSQIPNSKLQSSDQMFMRGSLRLALESRRETFWNDAKVSLDYGKIILKPSGMGKIENEVADKMLFENEMSCAVLKWNKFGGGVLGPLFSVGYNTEFTRNSGIPKRKIALMKAGVKMFKGRLIRNFHTAAVMERDFTFPEVYNKWAWETGMNLGGNIGGSGPGYSMDLSYKQFSSSRLRITDLKSEFELNAKLNIRMFSDFNLTPFASFYIAKGMNNNTARNYIFGVSLSYSKLFKIRN